MILSDLPKCLVSLKTTASHFRTGAEEEAVAIWSHVALSMWRYGHTKLSDDVMDLCEYIVRSDWEEDWVEQWCNNILEQL